MTCLKVFFLKYILIERFKSKSQQKSNNREQAVYDKIRLRQLLQIIKMLNYSKRTITTLG
jgi:hypothetical protein